MHCLRLILVALAAAVISSGVLAQADPKLTSTVVSELVPDEATLSRGLDSATPFIGRAAWRVKIKNSAATVLNRALFTAEAVVVAADTDGVVPGAFAEIDGAVGSTATHVIHVAGTGEACKVVTDAPTKISCNFTDSQLGVGEFAEFIIVVKTPTLGARLKLHWSFGGDEGKGGGNGCCTKEADTAYTALIDAAAANSTVKTHLQSFMVQKVLNKAFTGGGGGVATALDPWTTIADLGDVYTVDSVAQTYTQLTINEKDTSSAGSCSAIQSNACWSSQIDIPKTKWTVNNPLKIELQRHSSIIKKGSKLSNYFIQYKATDASVPVTLGECSSTNPPVTGQPCLDGPCVEIALSTSPPTYIWSCKVKALDNGKYFPN